MISYDTIEQAIVDSDKKHVSWLFDVGSQYWSTVTKSYQDVSNSYQKNDYTAKIIADSFSGISISRAKPEYGIQTPNEITFQVTNKSNTYTASDFIGNTVKISVVASKYQASEKLTNTGFETHTGTQDDGIEDAFTGYVIAGTNGLIDSTATVHSETSAIKIVAGAAVDKQISQTVAVSASEHYSFSFWHRIGAAGTVGRYSIYDVSNSADIVAITSTTSNSTSSFYYNKIDFTTPVGCTSIKVILYCSDTNGETVYYDDLSLTYAEKRLRGWTFYVTKCEAFYQTLTFTCEDYLQHFLKKDIPKPLVKNLFPNNSNLIEDEYGLPIVFGTAYIPLRLIITGAGEEYYLLGWNYTYTVSKQRVPRGAQVGKYEWDSSDYTFTQSTTTDETGTTRKVFINNIDDGNNIIFINGEKYYDVPTEITCTVGIGGNDQSTTGPGTILFLFLTYINSSFTTSIPSGDYLALDTTCATWGLEWNGGFYKSESAAKQVGVLLTMCHTTIESYGILPGYYTFKTLVKASQATITKAEVLRTSDQGFGTFKYSAIAPEIYDSGYVAYQELGEAQDEFIQILVPTKEGGTTANPSSEILGLPFIGDSVSAQKLGILHFQRKFLRMADISFTTKGTMLGLQCDDVITINDTDYGGNYDVLIENITFKKDLSLEFKCTRFSQALDDYTDLNPTAIIPASYQELHRDTRNYAAPERRLMEHFVL